MSRFDSSRSFFSIYSAYGWKWLYSLEFFNNYDTLQTLWWKWSLFCWQLLFSSPFQFHYAAETLYSSINDYRTNVLCSILLSIDFDWISFARFSTFLSWINSCCFCLLFLSVFFTLYSFDGVAVVLFCRCIWFLNLGDSVAIRLN